MELYFRRESDIECTEASEFLEEISPMGSKFRGYGPESPWLFRGLGDLQFKLVPSALRVDQPLRQFTSEPLDTYDSQVKAEVKSLIDFVAFADRAGLQIPDDSPEFRKQVHGLASTYAGDNKYREWLSKEHEVLFSAIALAQHFGLPTRLLDWTRNVRTAAHFAATQALRARQEYDNKQGLIKNYCTALGSNLDNHGLQQVLGAGNTKLALWAFHYPQLDATHYVEEVDAPFMVVTAPASTNSNLRAQQGVFTLAHRFGSTTIDDLVKAGHYRHSQEIPFDIYLEKILEPATPGTPDKDTLSLIRFTLPVSESGKLLWLLAKNGYTYSSSFPNLEGCINQVKEQQSYQKC